MSAPVIKRVVVSFGPEGAVEYAVSYAHDAEPPTPGSKKRATTAARMAAVGLRRALEGLDKGAPVWGGYATDTRQSTDTIIADKQPNRGGA